MIKFRKFSSYAVLFCLLGVAMHFFYSGLQNEHINLLRPISMSVFNLTTVQADFPITVAGFAVIAFYIVLGWAFVKFGVKIILVPTTLILGVSTILLGMSTVWESLALYNVTLFLVRLLVTPLQMGSFMLATNWFIRFRGRVMGIITIGGPLYSVVGNIVLTRSYEATQSIVTPYAIFGGVVIALALLIMFFLKDNPEDAGLYPDSMKTPPQSEVNETNERVTLKQILTSKAAWQLIISYGILQFAIVCLTTFNVARYQSVAPNGDMSVWNMALPFIAGGAAGGIVMSYVLGWIDDKLGTIKASLILNLLFYCVVIPMIFMPFGGSKVLMTIWGFGFACMTGGVATMHPCSVSYVYGRRKYQDANKWIMTIQAIMMAFTYLYMGAFFDAGRPVAPYVGLAVMLLVSLITILTMWKIPDANLADREYGQGEKTGETANT